jgi:hypothetical protein
MYQVWQPYAFVHTYEDVHRNVCKLFETDLSLIPVAATVTGTTYTALCFLNFPTSIATSWCLLHFFSVFLQVVRLWNSNVYEATGIGAYLSWQL